METKSKVQTFIGFAIRARKYKIGFNACTTLKGANLIVICRSASENTIKQTLKLARRLNCPTVKTVEKNLSEYVFKDNAKIMAITDKALSQAIIDNSEQELIAVDQENVNG